LDFLKKITLIIFILKSGILTSQIYEVGYITGKSNFIGDVGETTFINPLYNKIDRDWINGISFKWNRSPRHAYRLTFIKTNLAANDLNAKDPRRIERGYNFRTPLSEISLGLEFNMLEYNLHEYSNLFTPYFYTGIIHSKYNKQILQNGVINKLPKKNTTLGIPLVVGIKYRFFENFIISFEAGARYTFTDNIDGNIISNSEIGYDFGNINNNDWYMFSIMNLSYTFGRKPCYCNIK
jgi:hypothetical protein